MSRSPRIRSPGVGSSVTRSFNAGEPAHAANSAANPTRLNFRRIVVIVQLPQCISLASAKSPSRPAGGLARVLQIGCDGEGAKMLQFAVRKGQRGELPLA